MLTSTAIISINPYLFIGVLLLFIILGNLTATILGEKRSRKNKFVTLDQYDNVLKTYIMKTQKSIFTVAFLLLLSFILPELLASLPIVTTIAIKLTLMTEFINQAIKCGYMYHIYSTLLNTRRKTPSEKEILIKRLYTAEKPD